MARRIPHPALHKDWCRKPNSKICACCGKRHKEADMVMHHDHIMDFVLQKLREFAPPSVEPLDIWKTSGKEFRRLIRFRPVRVCRRCNNGDGWAKAQNWCGVAGPVYPDSFSMKISELDRMRRGSKGMPRRTLAETIYARVRTYHLKRERRALRKVLRLIDRERRRLADRDAGVVR